MLDIRHRPHNIFRDFDMNATYANNIALSIIAHEHDTII